MIGALVPLGDIAELVNMGTLAAFVMISIAVIILRKTQPDLPRAFRCPAVPWIPLLAILFCVLLLAHLPLITWIRFAIWLAIGFAIYFTYSRKRSSLNTQSTIHLDQ